MDTRKIALGLAEVIIRWEYQRKLDETSNLTGASQPYDMANSKAQVVVPVLVEVMVASIFQRASSECTRRLTLTRLPMHCRLEVVHAVVVEWPKLIKLSTTCSTLLEYVVG